MDFSKINLEDHQKLARIIVKGAVKREFKDRYDFQRFRNALIKEYKGVIFHNLYFIKAYDDLIREGEIKAKPEFLKLIQKRAVRTMSGVAPLTVLTKPFPCPGRCIYCPTDVRMPKSYLPSQPAAQRGFRQRFDPYTQVFVRLRAMQMTGHEVSKVELRILGGTWSAYPKIYQTWFVKRCLQAMNEFHEQMAKDPTGKLTEFVENVVHSAYGVDKVNTVKLASLKGAMTLIDAMSKNELSKVRCIGINVETRPDHITKDEVRRMRKLGVTKVEMGVQTIYDDIQKITKREQTAKQVMEATRLLKDAGFKIGYHMMPNLPGSNPKRDKEMVREIFENQDFQPDYLKIYPCVVMPRTPLARMLEKGEYKSYNDKVLEDILVDEMRSVPEWCRVDRLARDIPSNEIVSGFKMSNMRQVVEKRLEDEHSPPRDIRYREIGDQKFSEKDIELVTRKYEASGGTEFFISFEDKKHDKIIGLIRLRFPYKTFIQELSGAALVREVHVYGKQIAVGKSGKKKQHAGWGTKLLKEAERVACESGFNKIAVISGIGTREYYKKFGYELVGSYMVKNYS